MRKSYKKKLRSCGLCKPHKRGLEKRWKPKVLASIRRADREIRETYSSISARNS